MSKKTITKFCVFVIFCQIFCASCSTISTSGGGVNKNNKNYNADRKSAEYGEPQIVGAVASGEVTESSGIAASKCQPDVFWTHNDSGDDAYLFAMTAAGERLGTYKVAGAENKDWEDIAAFKTGAGECFLYVGDIGNNERLKSEMTIYAVKEPKIGDADKSASRKNPTATAVAEAIRFEYPDIRHDAETLLVEPQTGDIYVLTKSFSNAAGVYKLAAKDVDLNETNRLEKIADLAVPAVPDGLLTGGDISSDGRRVVVCDYFNAYEIVLPTDAKNFDEIWKQTAKIVDLGARKQGEAVGYAADGNSIYATSEGKKQPIIEVRRKTNQ